MFFMCVLLFPTGWQTPWPRGHMYSKYQDNNYKSYCDKKPVTSENYWNEWNIKEYYVVLLPNMAITMSSFNISMEPLEMK